MTLARRITGLAREVGAFSPSDIAGLQAWYTFDDIGTVWKDTARTSAVTADGDMIKGVTDLSGNAIHLSEATNGPTYKTAIQNGLSIARFDGSNDFLVGVTTQSQPLTVAMVAKMIAVEGGGTNSLFFDANTNRCILYADGATSNWAYYAGSTLQVSSRVSDTSYHVHLAVFDGASSSYRLDGSSINTANPGSSGISTQFYLGRDKDGAAFTNIEYGEVLVYDSAITGTDATDLENYLQAKWGTPSFDPTTVSGLVVWVRAEDIGGAVDDDPIATWVDASGNGFDLVQSDSDHKPTYQTSAGPNGSAYVRFDGTAPSDYLEATPGAKSQPNTYFAVWRIDDTSLSPAVIASDNGSNRNQTFLNSTHWDLYAGSLVVSSTVPTVDTWYVVEAIFDGASSELLIDGTSAVTGDVGSGTEATFRVGADSSGVSNNLQDIAEILFYNAAVSSGDRSDIRVYLGDKYGITVTP